MRAVEVDGRERKAAQIKFVADLQRREQIVVLRRCVFRLVNFLQLLLDKVNAVRHHRRVEAAFLAPAVEIRRVECQRLMDLEPRDAEGHHNIRRCVCFREEVFDLFTRTDVPLRNARGLHLVLRALGKPAPLSDGLHDLERALFGHAAFD